MAGISSDCFRQIPQLKTQSRKLGDSALTSAQERSYRRRAGYWARACPRACLRACYLLQSALHLSIDDVAPAEILQRRIVAAHQLLQQTD